MINEFYKRLRNVATLDDLKTVYRDIVQAFNDDQISIEQYNALRRACYNAKILRVQD